MDLNEEWVIPKAGGFSKAKWTPYAGRKMKGNVRTVVIRGKVNIFLLFMDFLKLLMVRHYSSELVVAASVDIIKLWYHF